jgi:hypothetical protein
LSAAKPTKAGMMGFAKLNPSCSRNDIYAFRLNGEIDRALSEPHHSWRSLLLKKAD